MKIAVGMSGGVDSSVAAALLKKQGHDVFGLTMQVWDEESTTGEIQRPACIGPAEKDDIVNAQIAAQKIGIEHKVIDLTDEYKNTIISYFTSEYLDGKTPNPCIHCNHKIKFGALLQRAESLGYDFDFFATGHYAIIEHDFDTNRYILKKAKYLKKDQSYFLARLTQEQLSKVMFPLSGFTKEQVREMAREFGLSNSEKQESQDFYSGDYSDLFDEIPGGDIVDTDGYKLGTHKGIIRYTIGQRRGLGVSFHEPLYVVDIDSKKNQVIVGTADKLYKDFLIASQPNWIAIDKLAGPMQVQVKIRYMHNGSQAEIFPLEGNKIRVQFFQPIKAITPGQTAVFYNDDIVIGSANIEKYNPA